ncbi:MAG: hypothetical protein KGL63_07270, partial [Betaproteobacteria bacterium]|nr:hypothetical protein [Betaproteobacteria bacterium]
QPSSVVVTPDGQNVYVSNYTDGTVSQYSRNAGTGALTALTPATYNYGSLNHINALAMPSDGLTLYGALPNQNVVGWVSRIIGSSLLFTTPPTAVAQYNGRAYYVVGNMLYFSDPLAPFMMTDAGQALTLGSTAPIKAIVGQPLTTGTQGILNALLAFKGTSIWQVSGDYSLNTLTVQELTHSVGSTAPRTIAPTPQGVFFMAVDGIRTVSLVGQVSEPNPDLVFPFMNVTTPSRAVAAYSADTYRICLEGTNALLTTGSMDYWYSLRFKRWTGPHSFSYNAATALGSAVILASNSVTGSLFTSNCFPSTSDTYTENGSGLTTTLISCPISPNPPMTEKAAVEMEAYALPGAPASSYQINVYDVLGQNQVSTSFGPYSANYLWNGTTWGGGTWGSPTYNLPAWPVYFPQPIVFKSGIIQITGVPSSTARLGPVRFRYEGLGYTGAD